MVFKMCTLASGSKGNCIYLSDGRTGILVDAGISVREIAARLSEIGEHPDRISAVLLTHVHSDHARCVDEFCIKYQKDVWRNADCGKQFVREQIFRAGEGFRIGTIEVRPISLSHDTPTCDGFVFSAGGVRAAVVTDLGIVTPDVAEAIRDLDCLVIECNHDPGMLAASRYPYPLRKRISGKCGHLDNLSCAQLIERVYSPRLTDVYLAHLSEENNTPELAEYTVCEYLKDKIDLKACRIRIAGQAKVSKLFEREEGKQC